MKKMICFLLLLISYNRMVAQENQIYTLRNCQNSLQTFTFQHQVDFFWYWVYGKTTLQQNKVVHFSNDYKIDSSFLSQQIERARKSVPVDFFKGNFLGKWYNNNPDEKAIWFMQIYAQKDKQGNFKVYTAYRITFTGSNAQDVQQRINPQVIAIDFIFDKKELAKLGVQLKTSQEAL